MTVVLKACLERFGYVRTSSREKFLKIESRFLKRSTLLMAGDTAAVETLLQLCIRSIAFRWSDFDSASLQTLPLELQQTILERVTPINVTDEQLP